ncbi:MAG: GNAT family N-acetyltransferase [Myxococcales bacterium]|jgi:ribosomal protein S18 acetylase RimI-like enzyme
MRKLPLATDGSLQVRVRRIHRRDLNRTWEFLKLVFRDVNRETVEYQRPFSKRRFLEIYDQEGIEQLLFEIDSGEIVGYAECAFDTSGDDNWVNPRYFEKRGMRPLFVDELAVHPGFQGRGVGAFMLDQLQHLARVRGCTHLVLEVAENNEAALSWYRKRNFYKLDAAIFLAQKVTAEPELLPPRRLPGPRPKGDRKNLVGNAVLPPKRIAVASVKPAPAPTTRAHRKPGAVAESRPAPAPRKAKAADSSSPTAQKAPARPRSAG